MQSVYGFIIKPIGKRYKNSNNLFNAQLLIGGWVTPERILDTYAYAELRKFEEAKDMNQNILAARELGVPEFKIRQKVKRRGINKKTFNNLMRGVYTPDRPGRFFATRMAEITRDLNQKEGTSIPNPFLETLPVITDIINNNRNTDLITGLTGSTNITGQFEYGDNLADFSQAVVNSYAVSTSIGQLPQISFDLSI